MPAAAMEMWDYIDSLLAEGEEDEGGKTVAMIHRLATNPRDQEAQTHLHNQFRGSVAAGVRRGVGGRSDMVDDAVQDFFATQFVPAMQNLSKQLKTGKIRGEIGRAVGGIIRDQATKKTITFVQKQSKRTPEHISKLAKSGEVRATQAPTTPGKETKQAIRVGMRQALSSLSKKERPIAGALLRSVMTGSPSQTEIAKLYRVSDSTVSKIKVKLFGSMRKNPNVRAARMDWVDRLEAGEIALEEMVSILCEIDMNLLTEDAAADILERWISTIED